MINSDMNLLHSGGKAYAALRAASSVKVKVELIEGAQRLKLIVGLSKLARSIEPSHLRYDSHS